MGLIHKYKKLLRSKGANEMSKFRNFLFNTMEKIRNGETPIKTGEAIHKTGHRVVMDKFADVKMVEIGIKDQELRESIKAMDDIKA
jgi:hypothetical protein